MKRKKIARVKEEDLKAELLPRLRGRVFHVTLPENFRNIRMAGSISPNMHGRLPGTCPQSAASFFTRHGHICVCDLRAVSEEQIDIALGRYYFLNPHDSTKEIFLFLSPECHHKLQPGSKVIEQEGPGVMVVPYVEAGHPGPIDVSFIEEVLEVHIEESPIDPNDDSWAAMMMRVHRAERRKREREQRRRSNQAL